MFQLTLPGFTIDVDILVSLPMSYCPNPECPHPQNPDPSLFCQTCGTKLLLAERYRPLKLIGAGGFGRTLLAVDEFKPSKPRCVVKQFYPQWQLNAQKAAELFQQEAVRLEQLGKHSQIPELFAHFEQDHRQYIVQEFIDGQNLAEELSENGRLSENQLLSLLNDLLPVLQFIHQGNVIHRDIKPENLIRRRTDKKLVLVDFGAAKYATGTTVGKTGTTIGTKGYAPLEQTFGKAVFASDIYSLGVTCIHLLTDREPFEMYDAMESTFVWRDYLGINRVSDRLANILDKTIESSVKQRYQSAEEVMKALNGVEERSSRTPAPRPRSPAPNPPPPPQPVKQTFRLTMPPVNVSEMTTLAGHSSAVVSVAIAPDGQILVSACDTGLKWWQLSTGKELPSLRTGWFPEPPSSVNSVTFSPDGKLVAAGMRNGGLAVWEVALRRQIRLLTGDSSSINSVTFSPDGKLVAAGMRNGAISLWDVAHWSLIRAFTGHSASVNSVAFSPDGQTLASGSEDTSIVFWNVRTGAEKYTGWGRSGSVNAVVFSPDGRLLATGCGNRTILMWEVASGQQLGPLTGHSASVNSVTFSADGQTLASASEDTSIVLWDVSSGQEKRSCWGRSGIVHCVAFSPDGQTFASGFEDKTVKIWQMKG